MARRSPRSSPTSSSAPWPTPFRRPSTFDLTGWPRRSRPGAQFIQTQLVFNVDRFREYMKRVVDMGLHEKTAIMAGIGPVRSLKAAQFMATKVPGMEVPDSVIQRLEGLSDEDAEKGRTGSVL